MADLFLIGQFQGGRESITAVSIGSQVMHIITVMLVGLAMRTFLAETAAKNRWQSSAESKFRQESQKK